MSPSPAPASVVITTGPTGPRQGDVVRYVAEARDSSGAVLVDVSVSWTVLPDSAGLVTPDGRFVGYTPGRGRLVVTAGPAADTLDITVTERGLSGSFSVVGHGSMMTQFTTDLWVLGGFTYTGTFFGATRGFGGRLFVWDTRDPANPVLTDSVMIDAWVVNDVKVRADGSLAVITHERSADGLNGITLLDLEDPAHPGVIARFTDGLEAGVHNVWVEGEHVYVVLDGDTSLDGGLRVLDIADPADPRMVAEFYAGSSFLHDVYVRDGLAFLSHWNWGLIILDVGNGIRGGTPDNPVEVSRVSTQGGDTHNAWYWPEAGYVFVGEEEFSRVTPGVMHVVDVRDLTNPEEVATFSSPGAPPHNFWVDEDRGILYVGWYQNGVRAIDVTGEMLGELDRQGREIAGLVYYNPSASKDVLECLGHDVTCTWAPQLDEGGLVYLSDFNTGLWVVEPSF